MRRTDRFTELFEIQHNSLEQSGHFSASHIGKEQLTRSIDRLWWLAQKHSNDYTFREDEYDVSLLIVLPGTCIPADKQIKMASFDGIKGCVDSMLDPANPLHTVHTGTFPLLRNTGGIATPNEPYLVLRVTGGLKTIRVSPARAVQQFHREKITPLNIYEGIALVTHYPEILLNHNIALPGSCFGTRGVPVIELVKGIITLTSRPFTAEDIRRGSASCRARITSGK